MSNSKFHYISWQDLQEACFKLSIKINKNNIKPNRIVAVSRGGLVVARILSDFLCLPISVFSIVAYTGIGKMKKPKVVEGLKAFIRNENILLVDEVADSGETYLVAIDYLQKLKPAKIFSCAPFIKSWTKYIPDYWQKKTDKWIIFPYETKESIDELGKTMDKNKIKSLGLPAQFVDYFFKKAKIAAPRG